MSCARTIVTLSLYMQWSSQVVTITFHGFLPYILNLTFFPVPLCDGHCALGGRLNGSSEIVYSNIIFSTLSSHECLH